MVTITKELLSGSTNGRGIEITQNATPGNLLHTADASANDELWLWAVNSSTSDVKITIEAGGVTVPDDIIEYTVPAEDGLHLLVPGLIYTGSVAIRAFAATANVLVCHGYVNRITA